jgi:hypothetical protein
MYVRVHSFFEAFFRGVAGLELAAQAVFEDCKEGVDLNQVVLPPDSVTYPSTQSPTPCLTRSPTPYYVPPAGPAPTSCIHGLFSFIDQSIHELSRSTEGDDPFAWFMDFWMAEDNFGIPQMPGFSSFFSLSSHRDWQMVGIKSGSWLRSSK